jgi:hypothetical protein
MNVWIKGHDAQMIGATQECELYPPLEQTVKQRMAIGVLDVLSGAKLVALIVHQAFEGGIRYCQGLQLVVNGQLFG